MGTEPITVCYQEVMAAAKVTGVPLLPVRKKDLREGRMKACKLYRWAVNRAHTLPRKAGDKPDRLLWPDFVISAPNATFEEKGSALRDLELAGVQPFYIGGTKVWFIDPMAFWPESVPNLHCPDCGSMARVTRDGMADSLRGISSFFCTDFMIASRHRCSDCPESIGEPPSS